MIAANPLDNNDPESVGIALPGVEVRVGRKRRAAYPQPQCHARLLEQPTGHPQCDRQDGWLHTGDKVAIQSGGHIRITGESKTSSCFANGEKCRRRHGKCHRPTNWSTRYW